MRRTSELAVYAAAILAANSAFAASYRWAGADGDWNTSGAWELKVNATTYTSTTVVPGDGVGDNPAIANGATVSLNAAAGATGAIGQLYVGVGDGASGTLNINSGAVLNGGANNMNIGGWVSGTGGTGTVVQSGGAVTCNLFYMGGSQSYFGGSGYYTLSNGTLDSQNSYLGAYGMGSATIQGGTLSTANGGFFVLGMGSGSAAAGSASLNISAGTIKTTNFNLAGTDTYNATTSTGTMTMSGGLVTTTAGGNPLVVTVGGYGTGTISQSGGIFGESTTAGRIYIGGGAGSHGTYNVSGTGVVNTNQLILGNLGVGAMNVSGGTVNVGANGITLGSNDYPGCSGTLSISGGQFNADSNSVTYVGYAGGSATGQLIISGGQVNLGYLGIGLGARTGGSLKVVGSAATINLAGWFSQVAGDSTSVYLDNSGLSTIHAAGMGYMDGTLNVGFKGGAALMASDTATVLTYSSFSNDFAVKPDTAMWTTNRLPTSYTITLAAPSGKAGLDAAIGGESSFAAAGFGHLAIANVDVASPLNIYLAADAGSGKTLADLVSFFNANGLSASLVSLPGQDYDVKLTFGTPSAATQHFGWDLSQFNSDASLSGVGVIVPEPASLTLIGAGALLLARRRRSQGSR